MHVRTRMRDKFASDKYDLSPSDKFAKWTQHELSLIAEAFNQACVAGWMV